MITEVTGRIDHRILLNYRLDPEYAGRLLPKGLRPKIVNDVAIGGICQVSLSQMRPKGLPRFVGTRSHNAAHRLAVYAGEKEGVFVMRRETNSLANALAGGRLFPGEYSRARFEVLNEGDRYRVEIKELDGTELMLIDSSVSNRIPTSSTFEDTAAVSAFFEGGGIGWSPKSNGAELDTISLQTEDWQMEPLAVKEQFSAVFSDPDRFPAGTAEFDSAMIMRGLKHSWIAQAAQCLPSC